MKKYRILCIETGEYLYRYGKNGSCIYSKEEVDNLIRISSTASIDSFIYFELSEYAARHFWTALATSDLGIRIHNETIHLYENKELFELVEIDE